MGQASLATTVTSPFIVIIVPAWLLPASIISESHPWTYFSDTISPGLQMMATAQFLNDTDTPHHAIPFVREAECPQVFPQKPPEGL